MAHDSGIQEAPALSPREREVLDLLAEGLLYREIGMKLSIMPETVRTYVKNICRKMRVRNRLEAVASDGRKSALSRAAENAGHALVRKRPHLEHPPQQRTSQAGH